MRALVFVALAGALAVGGVVAARSTDSFASAQTEMTDVELFNVCDAASTFVSKRELNLEAAERNAANSVYLTYARQADGLDATVQCRVDGDQVVWHVAEAEAPNGLRPEIAAERAAEVLKFRMTEAGVEIAPVG